MEIYPCLVAGTRTFGGRCAVCLLHRLLAEPPLHPSQSAGSVASSRMRAAPVGASLLASELHGWGSRLITVGH